MIVTCPSCTMKYRLDPEELGDEGRKVRCTDCGFEWFQPPEEPEEDVGEEDDFPEEEGGIEDEDDVDSDVFDDTEDEEDDFPEEGLNVDLSERDQESSEKETAEIPSPKTLDTNPSNAGRLAAALLFIAVLGGLWFLKPGIVEAWPDTAAVYSAFGAEGNILDVNDISFERFDAVQDGAEIQISGMIYNLKSEEMELPPLVLTLKDDSDHPVSEMIFALDHPRIESEGTLQFQKTLRLEDMHIVKLIELRPVTGHEYEAYKRKDQSTVSSAG